MRNHSCRIPVLVVVPLLTLVACTSAVDGAAPVLLSPAVSVTSRFSADAVHLYGGIITLQTVQGTYNASCKNPSGSGNFSSGTEWYVPIGSYASVPNDWSGAAMTGLQLDLVENGSSSCTLTVQALSYSCASCSGTSYTTAGGSTMALGTSYAATPLTFTPPALAGAQNQDGDPFYANFDTTAVAPWSTNPTINVLVSNDPSLATMGSTTATYTAYNGSTILSYVAPPDYTVTSGSTTAAATVDGNETVTAVSGGVYLAYTATPANSSAGCVYTTTAPTQTNAGIGTAFGTGTACPTSGDQSWATPFHTTFIDASNFVSVGNTLPKTGYVIFQNKTSGVSSYEQVAFTFNAGP